jgi:C4-dicarboxylate-specific signal transduction histidine kinase
MELQPSSENRITTVDLYSVLDELRILIERSFAEAGVTVDWRIPQDLPPVWADRYGLLQVFLNITRNSLRVMESTPQKQMTIAVVLNEDEVSIRFEDTGPGVRQPERLFKPFQSDADINGLGLYISRAIVQTFHGELRYEPRSYGSCFIASLMAATSKTAAVNE